VVVHQHELIVLPFDHFLAINDSKQLLAQNGLVLHRKHVANADISSGGWLVPKPGFGCDK
jgi:hypothetical protein